MRWERGKEVRFNQRRAPTPRLGVSKRHGAIRITAERAIGKCNVDRALDGARKKVTGQAAPSRIHLEMAPTSRKAPEASAAPAKRSKTADAVPEPAAELPFFENLFDPANVHRLAEEHAASHPYKYGVVHQLFEPSFLHEARTEIVEQLAYREKETDICELRAFGEDDDERC